MTFYAFLSHIWAVHVKIKGKVRIVRSPLTVVAISTAAVHYRRSFFASSSFRQLNAHTPSPARHLPSASTAPLPIKVSSTAHELN